MSQKRSHQVPCPQCGEGVLVELYDAINVGQDPPLRDAFMGNQLNRARCEGCGYDFRIDTPLLYHDPERRFIVYWHPGGEAHVEEGLQCFRVMADNLAALHTGDLALPTLHYVMSRVEMVERIFMLEAGLDVRMIEYVKYLIYSRNRGQVDPLRKQLLFNAEDSTAETLCFVTRDLETMQLEGVLQYDRRAYEALHEMLARDATAASLNELFPGPVISARRLILQ